MEFALITALKPQHHEESVTRFLPISKERGGTVVPHLWAYLVHNYRMRKPLELPNNILMKNYREMGVKVEIVNDEFINAFEVKINENGIPSLGEQILMEDYENNFDADSSNHQQFPRLVILLYEADVKRIKHFALEPEKIQKPTRKNPRKAPKYLSYGVKFVVDPAIICQLYD